MSKAKGTTTATTPATGTTKTTTSTAAAAEPEAGGAAFSARVATQSELPIRYFTQEPSRARVVLEQMRDFRYEHVPPEEVAGWLAPHRHILLSQLGLLNPDCELHLAEGRRLSYFRTSWEGPKEPAAGRDVRFGGHSYHFNGDGSIVSTVYQGADWPLTWRQTCQTARLITNGATSKNPSDPQDYQELVVCFQDAACPINPMQGDSTHCVPVTTCYVKDGELAQVSTASGATGLMIVFRNGRISFQWQNPADGRRAKASLPVGDWLKLQRQLASLGGVITCHMLDGSALGRLLLKGDGTVLSLCLNSGVKVQKR